MDVGSTYVPKYGCFVILTFKVFKQKLTPETKLFGFGPGARSMDMTSAVWPWKL